MTFLPGNPGGPGRPKGQHNERVLSQRQFADRILDPEWEARIKAQLVAGTLHPSIELRLIDYKYGKPVEKIELTGEDGGPVEITAVHRSIIDSIPDAAQLDSPAPAELAAPIDVDAEVVPSSTPDSTDEGGDQ